MLNKTDFFTKNFWKLYFIIIVASTIAYVGIIGGETVWTDEAFTFAMMKNTFVKMCKITANDVHPPLYYILLKAFTAPFKHSLVSAKLFSIATCVITIAFGGYQIKKMVNVKTALAFMILYLFFPFMLIYSIEVRMYALSAMFVFMAGVYAYKVFSEEKKRNIVLYALYTLCAAYTHYYALIASGIIFLELLFFVIYYKKEKIKQVLLSLLAMGVVYLPWLLVLLAQVREKKENGYWIGEITMETVKGYWLSVFGARYISFFPWISSMLFIAAMVYAVIRINKKEIILALCFMAVPLGTLLIGVGASVAIQPVFVIRYIVPAIPLLILFLAIATSSIRNNIVYGIVITIFIVGGLANYVGVYKQEYDLYPSAMTKEKLVKYDVDGYMVYANTAITPVLGYYVDDKPIYTLRTYDKKSNPFKNLYIIKNVNDQKKKKLLFFNWLGLKPSAQILKKYDSEYVGVFFIEGNWADVYILNRKNSKSRS